MSHFGAHSPREEYLFRSAAERRLDPRLRVEMYVNQYVRERGVRALACDVSKSGMSFQKLTQPFAQSSRVMALEFELPGTNEVIWAGAEPKFDCVGGGFHLTGVRFTALARKHERLIREYVQETNLSQWRWAQQLRRQHADGHRADA